MDEYNSVENPDVSDTAGVSESISDSVQSAAATGGADAAPDTVNPDVDDYSYSPAALDDELTPPSGFRARLRRALKSRGYLGLCFIVPALLMWLIYASMNVYPFGEESVLVLDLNGQYVYYFSALRDILTSGGSLLYTFRRALGGEFMGIIGYYLASPLSFIVALFPETMMTEALLFMFLLKCGLSGLTFGIYLDRTRKKNPTLTFIFSTMYALTAYAVVMQHNTMWIDNLILLPIILLGVEELIRHKKYKMLVISLSVAVISNFYIGYMTCIFVALYFFYFYYSHTEEERNPDGESAHLLKSVVRIGFCAIAMVAITAVMLWSSYYSLKFGKTEFTNPSYGFGQQFDFLDMISKMYFGSYDTVRPEGLPFLYSGMLTFMLVPLYFFVKNITTREKIATGIFLTFMFVCFNGSTLDIVWHGMQRPNWLNYRYSFMVCFLFLVIAHRVMENIDELGYRPIIISAVSIAALLLVLQKLDLENLPDLEAVWASLAFIALYLLLLRGATFKTENIRRTSVLVMAIFICFEMYAAGLSNLMRLDDDVVYSNRTGFRDHIDKYSPVVDAMREMDTSFYRSEKVVNRKTNDNLALDVFGLSNSTSTLNASTIKFLKYLGLASKSHWSKYLGSTPVADSILGVKYIIGSPKGDEISPLYTTALEYSSDLTIYENPYAMSVAFGVDPALASVKLFDDDESEYHNPFERMNGIVASMLGEESADIFVYLPNSLPATTNLTKGSTTGHVKYTPVTAGESAYLVYTLTAETDDTIFMYIPTTYDRECKLSVNGVSKGTYFGNETHRIVELGSYEPGTKLSVKLELSKDDLYISTDNDDYFYYFDADAFSEIMPRLRGSEFDIAEWTEDTLEGTINVAEGKELVYTSIPYDKGWKVICDGEEVETFEILDALIGFNLTPGEHTLVMKYRPDCVIYGSMISAGGIIAFTGFCVFDHLRKKRAQSEPAVVPVGDGAADDTAPTENAE